MVRTAGDLQLPDTYSESDASLDAMIFDLNLRFRFYGNLYGGVGYIYQNFDFDLSNVRQWNPLEDLYSRYDPVYYRPGIYGHGTGLIYEVTYHIPYLELAARGQIKESFFLEGYLRFSPYTLAKDVDRHLLRDPPFKAEGDCDGTSFIGGFKARWLFSRHWFVNLKGEMMKIETDGEQVQHTNEGVYQWTNGEEIESKQLVFELSLGYSF